MTVLCYVMAQHPHGPGLLDTPVPHMGCSLVSHNSMGPCTVQQQSHIPKP